MPGSMFVHVRCRIVSMPHSDCVKPARSRLLSLVEPPAPHVTLTAIGWSAERREMRATRLSKPWRSFNGRRDTLSDATHLVRARGKELERVERLSRGMLGDLVGQLHCHRSLRSDAPSYINNIRCSLPNKGKLLSGNTDYV